MKKILIFSVVIIYITLFLFSCKKQVSGCTDSTALNYNSSATVNDGSCTYGGNVVFWTNALSLHGNSLTVTLDNGQTTTINVNYTAAPSCLSTTPGTILNVPSGTHSYTAQGKLGAALTGTVVIAANACTQQQLN